MQSRQLRFLDARDGILIGILGIGFVLALAAWIFVHVFSVKLAEVHLKHRAKGIAEEVVRMLGSEPQGQAIEGALRVTMEMMGIRGLAVLGNDGNILIHAGKLAKVADGQKVIKGADGIRLSSMMQNVDGLAQRYVHVVVPDEQSGLVAIMDMEADGLIAWYRRIGTVFAEVITGLLALGVLVIGLTLSRRYQERVLAESALEKLRRQNAEEQRRVEALQLQLIRLQEEMAQLNRKLAQAMKDHAGRKGAKGDQASVSTGTDDGR